MNYFRELFSHDTLVAASLDFRLWSIGHSRRWSTKWRTQTAAETLLSDPLSNFSCITTYVCSCRVATSKSKSTSARPLNLSFIDPNLKAWRCLLRYDGLVKQKDKLGSIWAARSEKRGCVFSSDGQQQRADAATLGPEVWRHRAVHTH